MSTKTLRPKRIIIGVTGSVATIKLAPLIDCIKSNYSGEETEIKIVATNGAVNFLKLVDLKHTEVITDSLEWQDWKKISDPILHIDLRNWADVIVVAPLSANTLAKIANGLCDNLLTCIIRAWDRTKPIIICPAMNTHMYNHPITNIHLNTIKSFNYDKCVIVSPISKKLACGDVGIGAMAEVSDIVQVLNDVLE